MKRFLALFAAVLGALFVSGCATHYQFGTTLSEDLCYVYVPTLRNESDQPDAARYLNQALRKEIRREGTLRMVPEDQATTRLDVVITKYEQDAASYSKGSTQDPNRYRMRLTASVSFTRIPRAQAGEQVATPIWIKDDVRGDKTFSGGSETSTFKLQCLPDVSKELAETIVDGCIGAW